LTTTIQGPPHAPLHSGFQQSGCIDALLRLVSVLKAEHCRETVRFVKNIPPWLTDTCFEHACCKTSVRDADEYARRFRRLLRTLQTGASEDTTAVSGEQSCRRVERAVAMARVAFGAALEAVASVSASGLCQPTQMPADPSDAARLGWLCHDAYMAALWTDAHANYLLDVLDEGADVHQISGQHVDLGTPCINRTVSISTLPNVASKFEQYCSGAQHIDADSKHLLSVLFRCGQSGSRGWDSALKASLTSAGSQWVLHTAFKACLIGMHPQLHPSARPDWTQRALITRLFDDGLKTASMNELLSSCGTCTKESIRLYMCSVMNDIPATRSALARVQNSVGLLRSAPSGLVPVSLAAAAQNIVAAGIDAGETLSTMQPIGGCGATLEAVKAAIQNRIGSEPRVRSRSALQPRQGVPKNGHSAAASSLAIAAEKSWYTVSYNPSWFGRVASEDDAGETTFVNNSLNALTVIQEVSARAFRAHFVPFWVHGHGNGVRTSRFDESQHTHMLKSSALQSVIAGVEEKTALAVQRTVMQSPVASTATVSQVGRILRFDQADQRLLDEAKTFEEAIIAVCGLSHAAGSKLLLFGRVTSLKNRLLSFSLGPQMLKQQLSALRRRFEIPETLNDDEAVVRLPDHAHHLFFCLECKRVPNACVDDKTKMNSHNEIGLAQTMLRVGGVGDPPQIRCARRSSAALRTALQKEDDAFRSRVECMQVTDESLHRALRDNGDVSHAARLRRDLRTCSEQHDKALACGDRPLVRVSLLGKVVRMNGRFYAICSFCGSILQVSQLRRYEGGLCCCRCDASMVNAKQRTASQATRVAVQVNSQTTRPPPAALNLITPNDKLNCRYCNKPPPTSATAARFRVLRAPTDSNGRNAFLPPPLRTIALCQSHYRPWVDNALLQMPMAVVFAHISEKATPVYGAEDASSSRPLAITHKKSPAAASAHRTIMKRVRDARTQGRNR
jgi:hypothetical protein